MRKLPPLNSLIAFETAGRNQSFRKAADELHVSVGSICRFIAMLEDDLGLRLFIRHPKGSRLTPEGKDYLRVVSDGLNTIRRGTHRIREENKNQQTLTIWTHTAYGTEWLFPRLENFSSEAFPKLSIRIHFSSDRPDLNAGDVDLSIIALAENEIDDSRVCVEKLYPEIYFPVCSPKMVDKLGRQIVPEDLRTQTLLVSEGLITEWRAWLSQEGVHGVNIDNAMRFQSSSAAYRAARMGLGFALGEHINIGQDLEAGVLIVPFRKTVVSDLSMCMTSLIHTSKEDAIRAFKKWLVQQIELTRANPAIGFAAGMSQ